jgi:hypothetical protein
MMGLSIYIVSITAVAAILAPIATGVTIKWQRQRRTTVLVKTAKFPLFLETTQPHR